MEDGYIIYLNLSTGNLDGIKGIRELAISPSTTFIVTAATAIEDVARLELISVTSSRALQVGEFIGDNTQPELEMFVFDLGTGILTLSFSEAIEPLKVDYNELNLQNSSNDTTNVFSFSRFTISESDPSSVLTSL